MAQTSEALEVRDTVIATRLAAGEQQTAVGADIGLSKQRVNAIATTRADEIAALREKIRLDTLAAWEARQAEVSDALLDTAADSEKRHQPQAAKVLAEIGGVIAKGGGVHVGDKITNVAGDLLIDARSVVVSRDASERLARLAELESELGS